MKLDAFYTVEPDTACWVLTYEKQGEINPNTGKPKVSRDVSYHANLKQALVTYLDKCLEPSTDIQDAINHISATEERINKLFTPLAKK